MECFENHRAENKILHWTVLCMAYTRVVLTLYMHLCLVLAVYSQTTPYFYDLINFNNKIVLTYFKFNKYRY